MSKKPTVKDIYAAIIESSNDAIIGTDLKGAIISWNKAAENLYGYIAQEIIGLPIEFILPMDRKDEFKKIFAKIRKGKKIKNFETLRLQRNGAEIKVAVSILPIKDKSDEVIGAVSISKGIPSIVGILERKKEQEKLRLAIESTPSGILMVNKKGTIELANNQVIEMFHYKKENLIGKRMEVLIPERFRMNHSKYFKAYFEKPEPRAMGIGRDLWGLRSDGSEFPVEIGLNPLKTESGIFVLAFIIDISERKFNEQIIKKSNADLESFAYVVSHDLKAPLRGIGTVSEWILEEYQKKLDPKGKKYLELIESRVKKLQALIDGILEYSKIGFTREKPEPINLNQMIPEIKEILMPPKQIKIIIQDDLPVIYGEKTQIYQIFQNLISNAIHYNDKEQGFIEIGVSEHAKEWEFFIKDNGIGIDKEYRDKIFELFQTGHNKDTHKSSGVGLSLVKKIIELYGGKIWLKSKEGQGTTFYFTFQKSR